MTIGARLKELRKKLNITAKELALATDIPVRTIGGYERNENPPNEKFLTKLIEKYNVNINWFLTGKGNMFTLINSDLTESICKQYSLSFETAQNIAKLIQNDITRNFILEFLKAKNGDIKTIDNLIQNLNGIKVAFS